MRRSHDSLINPSCSTDKTTGVKHLRHHIAKDGYYRGKEILQPKVKKEMKDNQES